MIDDIFLIQAIVFYGITCCVAIPSSAEYGLNKLLNINGGTGNAEDITH